MACSYKYAIAQFRTDPARDERLNLALVVFKNDKIDVVLPKSLDKLRAVSAAVDLDLVRASLEELVELDAFVQSQGFSSVSDRASQIQLISTISLSQVGELVVPSEQDLGKLSDRLLARLVEPEPPLPRETKRKRTKLLSDVKAAFKSERVLARKEDNIDSHRVVEGYKIAEGLSADLLLKNGAMHVVQTVDAASDDSSTRKAIHSIAMSALVFEYARISYGDDGTKPNLIYKASPLMESFIAPSLEAAQHQGARLINWESRDDRTRFIVELSALATPLEAGSSQRTPIVHASTQRRFNLN